MLGGGGLVFVDGDAAKGSGNLYVVAIAGLVHFHLAASRPTGVRRAMKTSGCRFHVFLSLHVYAQRVFHVPERFRSG